MKDLLEQVERIVVSGYLTIGEHAYLQEGRHHCPIGSAPILVAIIPAEGTYIPFTAFFIKKAGL